MRVPVTIVEGALGSGKSRLVNRLVEEAGGNVAAIEAEFGDTAVEAPVLVASEPTAADLARALERLARRRDPLAAVFVEVPNAATAREALQDDEVADAFMLAGVQMPGAPPRPEPVGARATPPASAEPPPTAGGAALEVVADGELPEYVCALAWHPGGDLVAVACADGAVYELLAAGGAVADVGHHEGSATAVAYGADGMLATGGADGRVAIGTRPPQLAGAGWTELLEWSPDGTLLAAAVGSLVQLWGAGGSLVAEIALPSLVEALAWAPDGGRIAAGGTGGAVIAGRDGQPAQDPVSTDGRVVALAWPPDGRRLACGMHRGEVQVWDLDTRRAHAVGGFARGVRELAWNHDGVWLVTGGGKTASAWAFLDGTGDFVPDDRVDFRAHAAPVRWAAFQPGGPYIATTGADGLAVLWQLPHEQPVAALATGAPITAAAWSPDGTRLAIGTASGRIMVASVVLPTP